MGKCRILTRKDFSLIPQFVELFQEGIRAMGREMTGCDINLPEMAAYIEQDMLRSLAVPGRVRYYGHFNNESLDGQLIEELCISPAPKLDIRWIMAKKRKRGVGRELLVDCIRRAKTEGITEITTTLSDLNMPARMFYEHFGFQKYAQYTGERNIKMHRIL